MSKHLTPIEVCEALIGKPEVLGEICGIDRKAPFGWRHPAKGRLAGDITSAIHQRALLAHATAHRLGLTAEHLIWGAPEDEIAEILAGRAAADRDPPFVSRRTNPARSAAA
jgi:hypothetical protein